MLLQQLANIAEVFGMLVVAVTLIFLTVQMRQNTKALRSSTAHGAHEMAKALYGVTATDPGLADLVPRGMRDPDALSEIETAQFTCYWQNAMFTFQDWFYQWREGALDKGIWSGWSSIITDVYQTPGIRWFWQQRRHYFSEEFRTYLETDLFARAPTPDYRPLGTSPA